MGKQLGGLKLIHQHKQRFQAVYDMLTSQSSRVTLLTYASLKAFMFVLDVDEADSEYLKLSGAQFTKRVTSFILKLAVITQHNDEDLGTFNPKGVIIHKQSETKKSLLDESKIQQLIWKKSIEAGKPAICPSVANFSLFDNAESQEVLAFLRTKVSAVPTSVNVVDYLLAQTSRGHEIGVIVMPNIENSKTLHDFLALPVSNAVKENAVAHVLAQVVRLFLEVGVVHFDLHAGNALISYENNLSTFIIDFGRVSNIANGTSDGYLKSKEKQKLVLFKNSMYANMMKLSVAPQSEKVSVEKLTVVNNILDTITRIEHDVNHTKYNFKSENDYQMDWYEHYRNDSNLLKGVVDIVINDFRINDTNLSSQIITQYESKGLIVNFNKKNTDYYVPFQTKKYKKKRNQKSKKNRFFDLFKFN